MQREPVDSKSVRSVGYDAELCVLEVEWASGKVYRYFAVPASVHAWLVRAKSKGAFLNRLVKEQYRYAEVFDADPNSGDLIGALERSLREPHTDSSR